MIFCLWSSDNYRCDLYCYESGNGVFQTYVAFRRRVFPEDFKFPPPWPGHGASKEEWERWHQSGLEFMQAIQDVPLETIGLEADGESFCDGGLDNFLKRLLWLKELGYRFPDEVIDTVRAEIAESTVTGKG